MNTPEAILDLLQKQPSVCAEDLSLVLLKTRANIQYHLKRMEKAGWIEQTQVNAAKLGQGRPRHFYALSASSRANNILRLTSALLQALLPADLPPELLSARIQEIAQILFTTNAIPPQKTFTRLLNLLVKELTAQGYQARWEARAAGPAVVFHNCPYLDLLPQHPQLCQVDAALLRLALGKEVQQVSKIQIPQVPTCRFLVG